MKVTPSLLKKLSIKQVIDFSLLFNFSDSNNIIITQTEICYDNFVLQHQWTIISKTHLTQSSILKKSVFPLLMMNDTNNNQQISAVSIPSVDILDLICI